MYLEIISPAGKIFEGDVKLVNVPGSDGAFEVLNNHAPIVSTLEAGKIKVIHTGGGEDMFDIQSGVIEVMNNHIHILADTK